MKNVIRVDDKRLLDVAVASVGLVIAMPVMAVVALAMRLSGDRGPLLYRAVRVGPGGRHIDVLKIRTMRTEPGARLTTLEDPRVTRVGRVLRRYRLDELPQLLNVIRGDMSIVGPRPEDPAFVDMDDPLHRYVFTAKPGITGMAQLAFHDEAEHLGDDPERTYREVILPRKLELDRAYLEARTLRLDIAIMVRTLLTVLGRRSAAAGPPS